MGKPKRPFTSQGTRRIRLESVPDTGGTTGDPLSESNAKRKRSADYEPVEPPFKGREKKPLSIVWQELSPLMKVGGSIGSFFIVVVLPAVWYLSKLDTNVDTLKIDVRDVKQRTDGLERSAIRQDERIGYLEKGITNTKTDNARNVQKK
jgi:hypothetical protein